MLIRNHYMSDFIKFIQQTFLSVEVLGATC